ncbi:1-acyl-sn-glycerol-3-phosphate acyltransferase epsilon-like [Oscarella lobularis]|uniref:1-acyl-sn-glycerol-3-phosphate acyltransferase epsilon-like n=1 Tax=Oscarella lobularis TaxID=121494 RepID=UPI003313530F
MPVMLLLLSHLISRLGWVPTAAALVGCSPQYFLAHLLWRAISLPFPRRVYERGDEIMYGLYQSMVIFFFEAYSGVEFVFHGDPMPEHKENVIYMANHQCTVDWLLVDSLAIRQGMVGNIRYILKSSLKRIPLYGWYFKQHGCIYIKRKASEDEDTMKRSLLRFSANQTPMWIVVFPEGTRFNIERKDMIAKSQKYAADHNLVPLDNVLIPKTKAMEACFDALYDYADAVYDVTVAYTGQSDENQERGLPPSMPDLMNWKCREVHIHLQRIPMNEIPTDKEAQIQWIHQQFIKKDKLLKRFYSKESWHEFEDDDVICKRRLPYPKWHVIGSVCLFALSFIPFFATSRGRSVYFLTAMIGGIATVVLS